MRRLLAFLALAATLTAQIPPAAPAPADVKDPLSRETPQSTVFQFLEAAHAHDYRKAARYLDRRRMSAADRSKNGPEIAKQLEDLLDDTPFDIATLSNSPEGDRTDGLAPNLERLYDFHINNKTLQMQLERVEVRPGLRAWLVSAASLALIPDAHQLTVETPFEKLLPQPLVTYEVFSTPVWRWLALGLMLAVVWVVSGLLSRGLVKIAIRILKTPLLIDPLRLVIAATAFRAAIEFAPPASIARLFLERALGLAFSIGVAWAVSVLVDVAADHWHSRLDPRSQAISYSVLPLGRQVLKLSLFVAAILSVFSAWGYNTTTILAGLGVGGLAVALAAQKTIENLFGGISVIGDRPVLVGDVCRFGDRTGTIMHIGLRSTRIRTADRTIISVPNAQFSSMSLENISGRDKIWFHPTFNLRRDTTTEQLSTVLASLRQILANRENVELGAIPVRFVGSGAYSLDIEIAAYVKTASYDEFLAVQEQLLITMLQAIESAGTTLATPP